MRKESSSAFTLIELLVVIAIIGLLSTISIVALNQARSKARDARRVADAKQLVNAINMYYDQYGEYPPVIDNDGTGYDQSSDNVFMHNLVTAGLLSADMKDAWNNKTFFYYYWFSSDYAGGYTTTYCGAAGKYILRIALENNTPLVGFAVNCVSQSPDSGYLRCICFY